MSLYCTVESWFDQVTTKQTQTKEQSSKIAKLSDPNFDLLELDFFSVSSLFIC